MEKRGIAIVIIALCLISVVIGLFSSFHPSAFSTGEKQSFFSVSGDKLAYIALEGPIESQLSSSLIGDLYSAESTKNALDKVMDDDSVKGVLVKINSPGGTVAMSQEIYETIIRLRSKKPVVFSMSDLAASGGYYIASASDRIFAEPGTLTGSIGVIFSTFNAQGFLKDKLGIQSNVIKSGKFKDIGSPYRTMTTDERALFQDLIDTSYQQFLKAITDGRVKRNDTYTAGKSPLTVATLNKYADGRVFTGEQAQKLGFVDQLGGTFEAQNALNSMAQEKSGLKGTILPLVPYNRPTGFSQMLFGASEAIFKNNQSVSSMMPLSSKYHHKLLYVWE